MSEAHTHDVTATLTVDGLDDELHVVRFKGEEGLSRLYRFQLELASPSQSLDFGTVLGARALLTLSRGGQQRLIGGMVGAFRQDDGTNRLALYELTLVPEAWRLTRQRGCRIFQDTDALTIVEQLLRQAHLSHVITPRGGHRPPAREYCVQYREDHWTFINRLLEEEGYYYFFTHARARQVLTISNDPQVHRPVAAQSEVVYGPGGAMPGEEHVFGFSVSEQVQTGRVTLDDYSFLKPSLDLACASEADGPDAKLEEYDYPGAYSLRERGRALAEVRLQQHRAGRQVIEGRSDCTRMTAGSLFSLARHPRGDLNSDYVLCSVRHRGESEADLEAGTISPEVSYSNSFGCIRRQVPFRPPRLTARPHIRGAQTATVVGPPGEEVHVDAHGRVMVRFHWDRSGSPEDRASCWIRVGQLWAGNGWGGVFLPRVGQEVIVTFLEGDPDQPMITGCVYNAANMPPYPLPAQKTVSGVRTRSSTGGGGFNELRFEDNKGKEQLYTRAQRDRLEEVGNDRTTTVARDQALTVGRHLTRHVEGSETVVVEGDRSLEVVGAQTVVTRGDLEVVTRGDRKEQIDGTRTLSARKIVLRATDGIELQCGGASVALDGLGKVKIKGAAPVSMDGPLVKINASVTGRPAARLGDPATPAAVAFGSPTVLVGEAPSVPAAAAPVGGAVKDAELSEKTGDEVHLPKQPDLVRQALDAARKEMSRRVGELENQLGVSDMKRAIELGHGAVISAKGSVTSARAVYDDVMAASGHASSAVETGMGALKHVEQLSGHLGAMVDDVRSGRLDTVASHFNRALDEGREVVKDVAGAADHVAKSLDKMADAADKSARVVRGVRDAADKIFKSVSSVGAGAGKLGGFFQRAARWGERYGLLQPGIASRLTRAGQGIEKLGKALTSTGSGGSRRLAETKKISEAIRKAGGEVRSAGKEISGWGKELKGLVTAPEATKTDADPARLEQEVEQEQATVAEVKGEISAATEQSHEAVETLRHPSTSLGWRNSAATEEELDAHARQAAPKVQQMLAEVSRETRSQATLAGPVGGTLPPLPAGDAGAVAASAGVTPAGSDSASETQLISTDELMEPTARGATQPASPLLGVLSSEEGAGSAASNSTMLMSTEEAVGASADPDDGAGDSAETALFSVEEALGGPADGDAKDADSAETTLFSTEEILGASADLEEGAKDSAQTTLLPTEEALGPAAEGARADAGHDIASMLASGQGSRPAPADPESVLYSGGGADPLAPLAGPLPASPARSDGAVTGTVTIDHPEQVQPVTRELVARTRARGGEVVFDNAFDRPDPRGHGEVRGTLLLPTEGGGYVMSRVRLLPRAFHDTTDQSLAARSARVAAVDAEGNPELVSRKQQASWLMALLAFFGIDGTV